MVSCDDVVRETVSTETQVEEERRLDVEVQTTLSVSPDSAATSQGGGAAVVGSSCRSTLPQYAQAQVGRRQKTQILVNIRN